MLEKATFFNIKSYFIIITQCLVTLKKCWLGLLLSSFILPLPRIELFSPHQCLSWILYHHPFVQIPQSTFDCAVVVPVLSYFELSGLSASVGSL